MQQKSKFSIEKGKSALILGVNGQDGSYLAQYLYIRNWTVWGIGRQSAPRHEILNYLAKYISIDLNDVNSFQRCLSELAPDVILHAAAIHGPSGFKYEDVWQTAHQVNVTSLHAVLEYARLENTQAQVVYFSSAKVFGDLNGKEIFESSQKYSNCIYSITKNTAASLIEYYRNSHGINASVIWLFNHESERRSSEYFVMKIVDALQNSIINKKYKTCVRSLGFWSDWGSAREYMELLAESVTMIRSEDYILSTGKTVWARDVVEDFFFRHNLSLKDHIITETDEITQHIGYWTASNEKFKKLTGLSPQINGVEVYEEVFRKKIDAS